MRSSHRTPPYDRSLELRDQIGFEQLGLVTNEIWHDDPRQLGVLLARYKFVAQMLVDRHDVGELGCADAFGTRIVLQATKKGKVVNYTLNRREYHPMFIRDDGPCLKSSVGHPASARAGTRAHPVAERR